MFDALLFSKTPTLFSIIYAECLWKLPGTDKVLYLTFDDGPIPEATPFVLDQLKEYNAKATFFCVGKNVEANPTILKRILREGHSVGNHTYDHLNGWKNINKIYFENIDECQHVLSRYCGKHLTDLFRPPYGKLKPSQYRALKSKYKIAMWDVLSFDFDLKTGRKKTVKNVIKNAEPGSLIVFHDSIKAKPTMEYALPKVLAHFTEKGFKFEKL